MFHRSYTYLQLRTFSLITERNVPIGIVTERLRILPEVAEFFHSVPQFLSPVKKLRPHYKPISSWFRNR